MLSVTALLEREGTGISWADLTWNGWLGCQKVSPACDFCYAEKFVEGRLGHMGVKWGPRQARRRTSTANWKKPRRWQAVAAAAGVTLDVFSMSLADWADKAVDPEWRRSMATVIWATPNLRWMMLTKRIGNAEAMMREMFPDGVPRNVALGITVCNQAEADRDIPKAIAVTLSLGIRWLFLSMEPLLGPVRLRPEWLAHIDLVITGGESGKDARPTHPEWFESVMRQCVPRVAFHHKQNGEWFEMTSKELLEFTDATGRKAPRLETVFADPVAKEGRAASMFRLGTKTTGRRLAGREFQERLPE